MDSWPPAPRGSNFCYTSTGTGIPLKGRPFKTQPPRGLVGGASCLEARAGEDFLLQHNRGGVILRSGFLADCPVSEEDTPSNALLNFQQNRVCIYPVTPQGHCSKARWATLHSDFCSRLLVTGHVLAASARRRATVLLRPLRFHIFGRKSTGVMLLPSSLRLTTWLPPVICPIPGDGTFDRLIEVSPLQSSPFLPEISKYLVGRGTEMEEIPRSPFSVMLTVSSSLIYNRRAHRFLFYSVGYTRSRTVLTHA